MDDAGHLCWLSPTMFYYVCNETNLRNARRKHTNTVMAEAVVALVNRTRRHKTKDREYDKTRQERTPQERTRQDKTGQDKTMQVIKIRYNFPNASNEELQRSVERYLSELLTSWTTTFSCADSESSLKRFIKQNVLQTKR